MAWQSILGIAIMVIGFAGVLVAAKLRMESIAIVFAIVMLGGLGFYGWFYMNPPPDMSYQVFGKAVAKKIGEEVKKSGASKVVWVTSDGTSDYSKACFEIFKAAAGGNAEMVATADSESGSIDLTVEKLKEILGSCGAGDAVVLDVGCSMIDVKNIDFLKKGYKGPKIFLTGNGNIMGVDFKVLANAYKSGAIVASVIALDNIDAEFKPDEDKLDEAFSKRYAIVTKENIDQYKDKINMP